MPMIRLSTLPAFPSTVLCLGLALTACDRAEHAPAPTSVQPEGFVENRPATPLEKEMLALKGTGLGEAEKEAALRDLLVRHGYPVPDAPTPGPVADAPGVPLTKAAGTTFYAKVKSLDFGLDFTLEKSATVAPGATITAYTTRDVDNQHVDPILLAYYPTTSVIAEDGFGFKLLARVDDYNGSLDPTLTWKNTTSASRTVYILAHPFSSSNAGKVWLRIVTNGTSTYRGLIGGKRLSSDNVTTPVPAGCTGPESDYFEMKRVLGGGYRSGMVAVNYTDMKGIRLNEVADGKAGFFTSTVMKPGSWNYIMGFMLDQGQDIYESTRFTGTHHHLYDCP